MRRVYGLRVIFGLLVVTLLVLLLDLTGGAGWRRSLTTRGATIFVTEFRPEQGLGPLFNGVSCVACHDTPRAGGMGRGTSGTVILVGRSTSTGFDPLEGRGGPVARLRSVAELGATCSLTPGIVADANVTSVRNAPALFGLGLIETIPDDVLLGEAERQRLRGIVHGRPHTVLDASGRQRVGRFGWKAPTAPLGEFVGQAFRNELGITNPIAPDDLVSSPTDPRCVNPSGRLDDDGTLVTSVTEYITTLEMPLGTAERNFPAGGAVFQRIGCAECHTPALAGVSGVVPLYSDLLVHDLGPALDDGVIQGQALGREWRTTPLWGLRLRGRYLHDARAETLAAALLAHDGEAAPATRQFRLLSIADRDALLAFLGDL